MQRAEEFSQAWGEGYQRDPGDLEGALSAQWDPGDRARCRDGGMGTRGTQEAGEGWGQATGSVPGRGQEGVDTDCSIP